MQNSKWITLWIGRTRIDKSSKTINQNYETWSLPPLSFYTHTHTNVYIHSYIHTHVYIKSTYKKNIKSTYIDGTHTHMHCVFVLCFQITGSTCNLSTSFVNLLALACIHQHNLYGKCKFSLSPMISPNRTQHEPQHKIKISKLVR